jgi:hypothetical protein
LESLPHTVLSSRARKWVEQAFLNLCWTLFCLDEQKQWTKQADIRFTYLDLHADKIFLAVQGKLIKLALLIGKHS